MGVVTAQARVIARLVELCPGSPRPPAGHHLPLDRNDVGEKRIGIGVKMARTLDGRPGTPVRPTGHPVVAKEAKKHYSRRKKRTTRNTPSTGVKREPAEECG